MERGGERGRETEGAGGRWGERERAREKREREGGGEREGAGMALVDRRRQRRQGVANGRAASPHLERAKELCPSALLDELDDGKPKRHEKPRP